jgi:hypothetical protein
MLKRKIVVVFFVVLASPNAAHAESLPVRPGVIYCGDGIDITTDGVGGEDFYCTPMGATSPAGVVTLRCEHSEPEYGPPWTETATIVEDIASETVLYSDADTDGAVTLERCQ